MRPKHNHIVERCRPTLHTHTVYHNMRSTTSLYCTVCSPHATRMSDVCALSCFLSLGFLSLWCGMSRQAHHVLAGTTQTTTIKMQKTVMLKITQSVQTKLDQLIPHQRYHKHTHIRTRTNTRAHTYTMVQECIWSHRSSFPDCAVFQ